MTHPRSDTPSTVLRRNGPRYRQTLDSSSEASADLREFREMTAGLSNRMEYPSLEAQRAGTMACLHIIIRRFLMGGRRAGLQREWAQRLVVWVQRTVDANWPLEQTPLAALEQRAMAMEAADDAAEKCHDLKHDAASLQVRLSTQSAEIAADQLVLAKLQRRLEEMRGCQ